MVERKIKMKEYKVILVETVEHELTVKAKDESEIENVVSEMFTNNKVDFTKSKTTNVQMYVEK